MMMICGIVEDYDCWGVFFGKNFYWIWEGLLLYFKKVFNFVLFNVDIIRIVNIMYDISFWGNILGVYVGWFLYQFLVMMVQMEVFKGLLGVEIVSDSGFGVLGVYWYLIFMDFKMVLWFFVKIGYYDNVKRVNYYLVIQFKVIKIVFDGMIVIGVLFVLVLVRG